jgi:hypothetical protein
VVEEEARPDKEGLNAALQKINEFWADKPYKLAFVSKDELAFLEKNARFMTNSTFSKLVSNIKKDKQLASVPLCYRRPEDGKYLVLSGNHRLQAAISAGETLFMVFYIERELTRGEAVSIQLSHNALEGQDDREILKELWSEIENVSLKLYSGLDDIDLDELPMMELQTLRVPGLEFKSITLIFLPEEKERLMQCLDDAMATISAKDVLVMKETEFSRFIDSLSKVEASHNIRAPSLAMMTILDIFEAHLEDLRAGWEKEKPDSKRLVPISSVLGYDMISLSTARKLSQALDKAISKKIIDDKSKLIELLSGEFIKHGTKD